MDSDEHFLTCLFQLQKKDMFIIENSENNLMNNIKINTYNPTTYS